MMTRMFFEAYSTPHAAAPAAPFARRLLDRIAAWNNRRAGRGALRQIDDHLLRDIGLDRLPMRGMTARPPRRG